MSRIHKFDAIFNFRDFGDYATQDGRHIKPAKLFRSANFSRASEADLDTLKALNIGLRVDLRHDPEREKQPSRWPVDTGLTALDFKDVGDLRSPGYAPHEAFMKNDLQKPEDAHDYMLRSYYSRPDDPGFQQIFSQTLKHMAETGDNIVIHCAAGKDRTGTLGAIILSSLGVDQDTIMDDYMLTMKAVNIDAFLGDAAKMMEERYGRDYDPEALRPMFGVRPDYLEQSLKAIGDMDVYIRESLGVSAAERERLRAHYLAD